MHVFKKKTADRAVSVIGNWETNPQQLYLDGGEPLKQCCGTATIFYGSGSGSDY
jgi:hypothetical protein